MSAAGDADPKPSVEKKTKAVPSKEEMKRRIADFFSQPEIANWLAGGAIPAHLDKPNDPNNMGPAQTKLVADIKTIPESARQQALLKRAVNGEFGDFSAASGAAPELELYASAIQYAKEATIERDALHPDLLSLTRRARDEKDADIRRTLIAQCGVVADVLVKLNREIAAFCQLAKDTENDKYAGE
jgi:hypothetical protein